MVHQGIRLTPTQIVAAAVEEDVHVVVGGIVPDGDAVLLRAQGVAAVVTPEDSEPTEVLRQVVEVVRAAHRLTPLQPAQERRRRRPGRRV